MMKLGVSFNKDILSYQMLLNVLSTAQIDRNKAIENIGSNDLAV